MKYHDIAVISFPKVYLYPFKTILYCTFISCHGIFGI